MDHLKNIILQNMPNLTTEYRKELIKQLAGDDIAIAINLKIFIPLGHSSQSILRAKNPNITGIIGIMHNCEILPAVD